MKFIIAFCLISLSAVMKAVVNKTEQFVARSPKAEKRSELFSKELESLILWNYRSRDDFADGSVSLEDVASEFVYYKGVDSTS